MFHYGGKKTSTGVLLFLFYTGQVCDKTQRLWFPDGQLWANAGKLLLAYLGLENQQKESPRQGQKLQISSAAADVAV